MTAVGAALNELNTAILDLQAADYDTYVRPLRDLAAALADEALTEVNATLRQGLDFDQFVDAADQGIGGGTLDWPVDKRGQLGLTLILIERAAADPDWFLDFAHHFYSSGTKHAAAIRKTVTAAIIPFGRDYKAYVQRLSAKPGVRAFSETDRARVFIVHGHEEAPREMVARFLEKLGLEAIILHEQTNRGMTVAEKLETHGDVGFAIVLLTPDDLGRSVKEAADQPRARQNVVLELGYFVGRLGRDRVCALRKGPVEMPSDYVGVVYTEFDDSGGWKSALARELDAAGYDVDFNLVMKGR